MADEQLAMLGQVTRQTLGLARSSRYPQQIDLAILAEAALRIHQRKIEAKQIHLVKDLPRDLIAEVHSGEMLQVMSNLIVNALDAWPNSGILYLRSRKLKDKVSFVVADNWHGIAAGHAGEIFEPFFTTKEEQAPGWVSRCRRRSSSGTTE
jgi:C4-dicarboxylate-specific signal transduction histidine kinase